ncbi:DUF2304 domain-containing protein [Oribacterium sp. oral taxon 102]|uniref:DUF2304 domain-containing protein n=1 Tax=Oribacterium sp. oral taxon 102 TaxID=671214 RepID=UPI0015BA1894|nr:DUF2304 domain-containing protein [Oribacterium sp. oral taxon 102]NWO22349.1 DUF2304 domain-containing protein [Oribacterium sp. oral taxon 102]
MTDLLRVILIMVSVLTCAVLNRRIRRSKTSIESSVFWILLSLLLVLFALFPVLPDMLAHLLGIYSTANFLFLFTIFLLLLCQFHLSMELSRTEERLKTLVQEIALEKRDREEQEEETEQREPA